MAQLTEITDASFDEVVLQSKIPVLVEFTSDGCGLCKLLAPALADAAEDYADEIRVVVLNLDGSPSVGQTYNIQSVPQLFLFRDGAPRERLIGNQTRGRIAELIETHLEASL
uniref:thioredoxin family protein n=1 Tax=uncultured Caulobacter sp. TaxID=158749 RepID=UPI0025EF96B5|nr:thioredoxin domain-containing protein [uncultured Caulobacter sp.]